MKNETAFLNMSAPFKHTDNVKIDTVDSFFLDSLLTVFSLPNTRALFIFRNEHAMKNSVTQHNCFL